MHSKVGFRLISSFSSVVEKGTKPGSSMQAGTERLM